MLNLKVENVKIVLLVWWFSPCSVTHSPLCLRKAVLKKCAWLGFPKKELTLLQEPGPRMWKPGCPHPSWKAHSRTLGGCPVDFPSSVSPHYFPLSVEDLERYRDLWALKRPVCKTGYFWSQCYPSKRTKYTGKPQGRASLPSGWNCMLRICYCNVSSLTFSTGGTVTASCVLCMFGSSTITRHCPRDFLLFLYLLRLFVCFSELKYSHLTEVVLASHVTFL